MAALEVGEIVTAPSTSYVVKDIAGEGTFGQVAFCRKTCSDKTVALKVIKNQDDVEDAKDESLILQKLRDYGSENFPIVQWFGSFEYRDSYCLEFERLDISLADYIDQYTCMSLMQIRPILYQMAKAMEFVSSIGIIHGDLKPENVMLVDHKSSLQIKIIDFGSAHTATSVIKGDIVQTAWYRAPEVFVGTKYTQAIDVWSLGCIAVEMLTGKVLFPGECDTDMVRHIVKTTGTPPHSVLRKGKYTNQYFDKKTIKGTPKWRMKTSMTRAKLRGTERTINNLEDLYQWDDRFHDSSTTDRALDWEYFIDLVMKMLCVDPEWRISPADIRQQPFISMRHMVDIFDTEHVGQAVEIMRQASSLPEHLKKTSSNSSKKTSTKHNQQRIPDEQAGAERSEGKKSVRFVNDCPSTHQGEASNETRKPNSAIQKKKGTPHPKLVPSVDCQTSSSSSSSRRKSTRQKGKCDTKKKRKKTIRFEDSSPSTDQGEEDKRRPNAAIQKKKGTPHPKLVPSVDCQTSSNSSSSSRKSTKETCLSSRRKSTRQKGKCNTKKRKKTIRFEFSSPSTDRREENKRRPNSAIKRRKGSPYPKVIPTVDQASSSSSNDSWKTAREDTDEEIRYNLRKRKRCPSKPAVDQTSSSSNDSWKSAKEHLSNVITPKRKRSPHHKAIPTVDQAPISSNNDSWKTAREDTDEEIRYNLRKRKRKRSPSKAAVDQTSSSSNDSWKTARGPETDEEHRLSPPKKKRKRSPSEPTPAVGQVSSSRNDLWKKFREPEDTEEERPFSSSSSDGSRKRKRESEESDTEEPTVAKKRRKDSPYPLYCEAVHSSASSGLLRQKIQKLNLNETEGERRPKSRVLKILLPIKEVSPESSGGSSKRDRKKSPATETARPKSNHVPLPAPVDEEQVSSQPTPVSSGGPMRRRRSRRSRGERRSATKKRSRSPPRT